MTHVPTVDEQVVEMLRWLEFSEPLPHVQRLTISLQLVEFQKETNSLKEKVTEYDQLFALQHSRMGEATKRWQDVTGKHGILPDLGDLLDWLLKELDEKGLIPPRATGRSPACAGTYADRADRQGG